MVVLGGWAFSYERGAPGVYGPEGPTPAAGGSEALVVRVFFSQAMRLCWFKTRPCSSHVGHAAPDDTLTLLGEGPDAALEKEASMWYRGTSLIRSQPPIGPYRRPIPRVLGGSQGGERRRGGAACQSAREDSAHVGAIGLALEPFVW